MASNAIQPGKRRSKYDLAIDLHDRGVRCSYRTRSNDRPRASIVARLTPAMWGDLRIDDVTADVWIHGERVVPIYRDGGVVLSWRGADRIWRETRVFSLT